MHWFNKSGPTSRQDRQRLEEAHRKRHRQERFGSGILGFFGMLRGLYWAKGTYRLAIVSSGAYVVLLILSWLFASSILHSIRHGVGWLTCVLWLAWLLFLFGPLVLQAKQDHGIRFLDYPLMLGRYIRDGFLKQEDPDEKDNSGV